MHKGQCQWAETHPTNPRCPEDATRKYGNHFFCEEHGQRPETVKLIDVAPVNELIETWQKKAEALDEMRSVDQPTEDKQRLMIKAGVYRALAADLERATQS